MQKIPIFSPSNYLKIVWDLLNCCSNFNFFIVIPLQITFDFNNSASSLNLIAISIIIFDIFITFNTSYYSKGDIVTDRIQICFNYFTKRALFDIISVVPILVSFKKEVFLFKLLFFLRISHLINLKNKIEDRLY